MHLALRTSHVALLFLLATSLFAQEAPVQVVKGSVRSVGSQQPIAGVTVVVDGTRLGAVTRADGTFQIPAVPVGRHTLGFRSIGYESASLAILVTSGRQTVVDVELLESVVKLDEIVIGSG